jgi:hypothetical protein
MYPSTRCFFITCAISNCLLSRCLGMRQPRGHSRSLFIVLFTMFFHLPFLRSCPDTQLQKNCEKKIGSNKDLNYFLFTFFVQMVGPSSGPILNIISHSRPNIGHTSAVVSLFISVIESNDPMAFRALFAWNLRRGPKQAETTSRRVHWFSSFLSFIQVFMDLWLKVQLFTVLCVLHLCCS